MTTSNLLTPAQSAFVWTWLPGATSPVVAGRIDLTDGLHKFTYGRGYLGNPEAIPLYMPELPLQSGAQTPRAPLTIAGCLRDAAPDHWGRKVILAKITGRRDPDMDTNELDELNYLLHSGSDRIGALDFQASASTYVPRGTAPAPLTDLLAAADAIDRGILLPAELDAALNHGTSIGGARPKALLEDGDRSMIAKFSSSRDVHEVVKAEFIAMRLAAKVGIQAAHVELVEVERKTILLIDRFDRQKAGDAWTRRHMVSALTILGLDEDSFRYGSYEELAGELRRRGSAPKEGPEELFRRMVFNILIGNSDDHPRNTACFWDGTYLTLTPAYDIDPRPRLGREMNQALAISGRSRESRVALAIEAAPNFGLTAAAAEDMIIGQVELIRENFDAVAREADLSPADRNRLAGRAILNSYAFEGAPERIARLDRPL